VRIATTRNENRRSGAIAHVVLQYTESIQQCQSLRNLRLKSIRDRELRRLLHIVVMDMLMMQKRRSGVSRLLHIFNNNPKLLDNQPISFYIHIHVLILYFSLLSGHRNLLVDGRRVTIT
jgi:hypothetical protein